jgi:hypothetical protein
LSFRTATEESAVAVAVAVAVACPFCCHSAAQRRNLRLQLQLPVLLLSFRSAAEESAVAVALTMAVLLLEISEQSKETYNTKPSHATPRMCIRTGKMPPGKTSKNTQK